MADLGRQQMENSAKYLSRNLVRKGAVSSPEVALAFARVDRSDFCPRSFERCAWDDQPLRGWDEEAGCVVHLSAPSIYAVALEALSLSRAEKGASLSFLNVGSGSGYLSALAACALGPCAVHHCVEVDAPLAARCTRTFGKVSKGSSRGFGSVPELRHARVHCSSVFDVDVDATMRFDRIYVGAGARAEDARRIARLLKPGGVLVGPFEDGGEEDEEGDDGDGVFDGGFGGPQRLIRATRLPGAPGAPPALAITELLPVQFTPLVRRISRHPQVRILGPRWSADSKDLFGADFRVAVALLLRATARADAPPVARLPWHVWDAEILACLSHDDVLGPRPKAPKDLKGRCHAAKAAAKRLPAATLRTSLRLAKTVARTLSQVAATAAAKLRGIRRGAF